MEADEITLNDGSKRIGRIVEQTPDRIIFKDPRSTLEYQRSMIAGAPARVRVAALDVFTKDELFNEKLGSVDVTTAQGNFDLALFLSQTQDFARAIQYLNDAKKIDPNFHPGEIQKMLTRLEAQKLRQDEFDYLRDIEFERNQYHYDKAIALCDGFVGKFPKAAPETKADVEKRKKNVLEMKQKAMMRANFDAFYHAADMLARSKASDRKVGLEAAKAYANGEMKTEVAEATTKAVQRSFPDMTTTESQKL